MNEVAYIMLKRLKNYFRYARVIGRHPGILQPHQPVFLLSHMRSYSSVFIHILGSHPDIMGGSEMLQSYKGYKDLLKLQIKCFELANQPGHFVSDKLLNNEYHMSTDFLTRYKSKVIFTLRDPVNTINSLYAMYDRHMQNTQSVEDLVAYYINRANTLYDIARELIDRGYPYLFFEAEELLEHTDQILSTVTRFLALNRALRPDYDVHADTGKPYKGDMSEKIHSGKVLKAQKQRIVTLDGPLKEELIHAYDQAYELLKDNSWQG